MHLQFEEHKVPEVVSMHPNNWHCKIPSRKDQTVSEQCIYKSRVGLSEAKTIKLMHLYVCVCMCAAPVVAAKPYHLPVVFNCCIHLHVDTCPDEQEPVWYTLVAYVGLAQEQPTVLGPQELHI